MNEAVFPLLFITVPVIFYFLKRYATKITAIPIVREESATLNAGQWKVPTEKSTKSTTFP